VTPPLPFTEPADLVVFDVDGTLHDAFRWWQPVLHEGLSAYAARHGVRIPLPERDQADAVVGLKDEGVWGAFLPGEHAANWRELREICIPIECERLLAGDDYLYAGVRSLLARLRAAGVGLAIASNCRARYFDAMCRGQGLGPAVDLHFCLDTPGITDKTSMLATALERTGARSAVMVGDREPDLEAARAVGLPFVWRENPRCDLAAASDAVWSGDGDELARLVGVV
jgi:phosphoglycolate phosphatase